MSKYSRIEDHTCPECGMQRFKILTVNCADIIECKECGHTVDTVELLNWNWGATWAGRRVDELKALRCSRGNQKIGEDWFSISKRLHDFCYGVWPGKRGNL